MKNKEFLLILVIISLQAYAVPVSVILEDQVQIENKKVIHSLRASMDIENVTIVDYFSEVNSDKVMKEEFLGKEWNSIKMEIGNLKKGETKVISYEIHNGNGTALLGADTYYLKGERHQLFPEKVEIDIKADKIVGKEQYLFLILLLIIAIVFIILIKKLNQGGN